jgi:dinuclear metal center YbgI/SA1388 family protein
MTVGDIEKIVEQWAPKWSVWDGDNVGLQVGDRRKRVKQVLVALDATRRVITEAINKKVDLIVTHHPLLYRPLSSVTTSDEVGRLVLTLAQHGIALYSAHTNLDCAFGGVSFALGASLGLQDMKFLSPRESSDVKIVVFVPPAHTDRVASAMMSAGGGTIGRYDACSFRSSGTGTFYAGTAANPSVGSRGTLEHIEEVRLEMVAPMALSEDVVAAIRKVHPYEEVAYDIYPVRNHSANFGMGVIGQLKRTISLRTFLLLVKRSLNTKGLRFRGDLGQNVRSIAVCGGSGSHLLETAIRAQADAFVTADVKYHTFQAAAGRIALVDAGHWETERPILEPLASRVSDAAHQAHAKIEVHISNAATNPVHTI